MRFPLPLLLFVFLAAACAQEIPQAEGVYLRRGREWIPLPKTKAAPLLAAQPTDLKALQAVQATDKSDSPRLVFVKRLPSKVVGLRREGGKMKPFNVAAAPHEDRKEVWELSLGQPAPEGLIVLRLDEGAEAVAFTNGLDGAVLHALGLAEKKAKNLDAAKQAFTQAVKAEPGVARHKNELARVLAALGSDLGDARGFANDAIAAAQDDRERALYYDTLGAVYLADGEVDKAMGAVERAISLDLQNPGFHTHLTTIIEKAQETPPEDVFRRFYDLLGKGEFGDAADLASRFDVERLDDADQLKSTLQHMARGAPFTRVEILSTIKHGKVARFKFALIGQDGGRRVDDIQLQFEDKAWTISLP